MGLPSLFVSHGAPTLLVEETPVRRFLSELSGTLPRPRAILAVSAHWETAAPATTGALHPHTIHDFFGFPDALYEIRYPAPGHPELAEEVAAQLTGAGLSATVDPQRGLDHGAWQFLALMYPRADVPVVQLSLQPARGAAHHLALGRALMGLGDRDVLVIGSGSLTHNLMAFRGHAVNDPPPDWVREFGDWIEHQVSTGNEAALIDYRRQAPHAARNHPTEEHFFPLLVALGAAGEDWCGTRLHTSHTYGVLQMDAYAFRSGFVPDARTTGHAA